MDQAPALYESIAGLKGVRQLLKDGAKEDLHLEFKTKKNESRPELHDSDVRSLSRVLSGFANSDGGVLVWGVETDAESRASVLKPIAKVADFESRLQKSLLNAVQPTIDGLRMESIPLDNKSGHGFVKMLIPRSDKTPHRSMYDREYVRRSGDQFYNLEHFDLEDAFGRRPRPVLELHVMLFARAGDDPFEDLRIDVRNAGRGLARHVNIIVEFPPGTVMASWDHGWSNNSGINNRPVMLYNDDRGVIHAVPVMRTLGNVRIQRPDKGNPLPLKIRWVCEGMAERVVEAAVPVNPPPAAA